MPFKPGQSGNPLGRPKGAAGLARHIAEQTGDGRELVDRLLDLSRDARAPARERIGATMALLDRLAGKPMQPSEVQLAIDQADAFREPVGWREMPPDERLAHIDEFRARAIVGASS